MHCYYNHQYKHDYLSHIQVSPCLFFVFHSKSTVTFLSILDHINNKNTDTLVLYMDREPKQVISYRLGGDFNL